MKGKKDYLIGIYEDEDELVSAVKKIRNDGVSIYVVFTPFPVHGLGHALGYKRSKLSVVAFMFGILGTSLALTMQFGMMGVDWPMIIGGKDYAPLPTFIPVTFELTVLLAALGMVGTFMVISDLRPYGKPKMFDIRSTDDKHVVVVELEKNAMNEDEIRQSFENANASEIYKKQQ